MEENEKKTENVQEKTKAQEKKAKAIPREKTNVQIVQEDFDKKVTEKSAETVDGHVRINKKYFRQYLQICTNLYINYTVIDKVLDVTGAKAYVLSTPEYEFLLSFIQKAKDFTLFSHFIDMLEEAQAEAIELNDEDYYNKFFQYVDALEDLFGLEYQVFEGLRQIRLGIFAKDDETSEILYMRVYDLEEYFEYEDLPEYRDELEIANRNSFYNEADAHLEDSYVERGIGQHAIPTLRTRYDLSLKFDFNAGETEFYNVEDALNILEHLKSDLAGIEYNPLGINHAGAFFLANLGDTKRLKKLDATPAVKSNEVSTAYRREFDLADVPSKYEQLWVKMFKPITATLILPNYKVAPYREFMMPFDRQIFTETLLQMNEGEFTYNDVFQFLKQKIGQGSPFDAVSYCGLSEMDIQNAMNHVQQDYVFHVPNMNDCENKDVDKVLTILEKIDSAVLQKQIDNFIFDVDNGIKLKDYRIKEYTKKYSVIPVYAKELKQKITEHPEIVGGDAKAWSERLDQEPIRQFKDNEEFIDYKEEKIAVTYRTGYEMDLLTLLDEHAPELAEIIKEELQARSGWILVEKLSDEKHLCVVKESAFRVQRRKSNKEIFETETARWNQNIYSLSHLIESIIDTIEKVDKNAYGRLSGTKARRTKHEQMYDAVQSLMDLEQYAQIENIDKKIEGHGTGAVNDQFKDDISYNDIETIGIVKPFMLDMKESELLRMILSVRKDVPEDHEEWTARNRMMKVQLQFYRKTTRELLDIAEICGVKEEAEKLKDTIPNRTKAKQRIRDLILQAIKKEIEEEKQNGSQGDSKVSKGN